jgi:hypothetical protein
MGRKEEICMCKDCMRLGKMMEGVDLEAAGEVLRLRLIEEEGGMGGSVVRGVGEVIGTGRSGRVQRIAGGHLQGKKELLGWGR